MKYLFIFITLIFSFNIVNVQSEEITKQSFIGKWCGKWDQIFEFCLTIDDLSTESMAKYQWKEFTNSKFKKSNKTIKRINRNTLKIDNLFLILNESDLSKAQAIGIFKVQSRISLVTKSSLEAN